MNQNSKLSNSIRFGRWTAPCRTARGLVVATLLFCLSLSSHALAQNHPSLPTDFNTVNSHESWTPPKPSDASTRNTSSNKPPLTDAPTNNGFPESPIAFSPYSPSVNPPNSTARSSDGSLESTIDSTASMISNLGDSIGEKTSAWLGEDSQDGGLLAKAQSLFGSSEIGKMLGSLALVLGLYFAFVWVMRKINPVSHRGLPPEVISVMGQIPFGPRRNLQLVRLGSKLLLLMNSPEGTQPLGEINDAVEVEYLTSLCPGKNASGNRLEGLHRAAKRLTETSHPAIGSSQSTPSNTNLSQVIQMLENAAKQGGTVFEA